MTRVEAYDAALLKLTDPAVVLMGERHIIGQWVSLAEWVSAPEWALPSTEVTILRSKTKGVRIVGEGASWEEALKDAEARGWPTHMADVRKADFRVTDTRMATIKDAPIPFLPSDPERCKTYGCNEPRKEGDPFCSKCFEEHRDAREMQPSPPSRET